MTHPHPDRSAANRHVERGLEQTSRLGESRHVGQFSPEWYAEAAHLGDLTALAALTLTRSPRS